MKKIISLFLAVLMISSFTSFSYAEELKDTNVIGEIKFSDPEKINLSDEEMAETVQFEKIESIKTGETLVGSSSDEDASILYDFDKAFLDTDKNVIRFTFKEETSVSGIRLYNDELSVIGGEIYGSVDGNDYFLIGGLNVSGGKISVTDFGFNVNVKYLALKAEGELSIPELHVLKGKDGYDTVTEETLSDALYYKSESKKWTITADSEYKSNPAKNMFDGNKDTFWHSDYTTEGGVKPVTALPHSITVKFNEEKVISGLRYTPRSGNSRIVTADIYISPDGNGFYKAIRASFSYSGKSEQVVDFGENIKVKAVKFVSCATEGNQYSTGAELEFKKPDMAYITSDNADEVIKAYTDKYTVSEIYADAFDGNADTAFESRIGDVISVKFNETWGVSGVRIHSDGENITRAKFSVSYDGTNFIDFAENDLLDGCYLFRANLKVKAIKVEIKGQSAETVNITEIAPVAECAYYNEIALNNEFSDTSGFTVKATSQNTLQPASNLIDGNIHTIWHSFYDNAQGIKDKPPIDIIVDFGELKEISGFNYYPTRQNKNAESAGFFKKLTVAIAFEEGENATWYPLMDDSYSYGSYYAVQTTSFDFNYKIRQIKITVKEGNLDYATAGEIRFLKGDNSKKPKSAEATSEFAVFEYDEQNDVSLLYKLNDAKELLGVEFNGTAVSENYYTVTNEGITLSKYFFSDYIEGEDNQDITLRLKFFRGEDIAYTVKIGGAEKHKVVFTSGANGSITAKAGDSSVLSGSEVKRSEKLIFTSECENGYKVSDVSITTAEDVYEKAVVAKTDYTVSASDEFSGNPAGNMNDGNINTYWHSYYEVENGSAVNLMKPPHSAIVTFPEKINNLGGMSYVPRQGSDGGRIIRYKVYVSYDGENFETTPVASGTLRNVKDEQEIKFNSILNGVSTIKLTAETTSGGTTCEIAEVNMYTLTKKYVTYKKVHEGTKTAVFEIDDLFADISFAVNFEAIPEGEANITYDVSHIDETILPSKAEKGKDAVINIKAVDGYWVPEEVTVMSGTVTLYKDNDYTYSISDNENAVLTVRNVSEDIKVVITARDHDTYKLSYTDKYGATGDLPEDTYVRAGTSVTLTKVKPKLAGYVFTGWSYEGVVYKSGAEFVMPAYSVNFETTWEKDTSIEEDGTNRPGKGNGGGGGGGGFAAGGTPTQPAGATHSVYLVGTGYVDIKTGEKIPAPKVIAGYEFMGWFLDEALTVPYNNSGVTESVMLYPYYKKVRNASDFKDIEGHWAKGSITDMYLKGFVSGKADGIFDPDSYITRAEFCQILFMMSGGVAAGEEGFKDVSDSDWYKNAVTWAVTNGITKGMSEDEFAPNERITREQMAVMIYRYATNLGIGWEIENSAEFSDSTEISDYAQYQISWASEKGIVKGYPDNAFRPKNNATRAEAVTMLQRLLSI